MQKWGSRARPTATPEYCLSNASAEVPELSNWLSFYYPHGILITHLDIRSVFHCNCIPCNTEKFICLLRQKTWYTYKSMYLHTQTNVLPPSLVLFPNSTMHFFIARGDVQQSQILYQHDHFGNIIPIGKQNQLNETKNKMNWIFGLGFFWFYSERTDEDEILSTLPSFS